MWFRNLQIYRIAKHIKGKHEYKRIPEEKKEDK